jgi:hypothetical protein
MDVVPPELRWPRAGLFSLNGITSNGTPKTFATSSVSLP